MTPKEAPNFSSLNNTLETVNRERAKIFRRALALFGSELDLSDETLINYLSDISQEFYEIHLLGEPEELMPSFMSDIANKRVLYLSDDDEICQAMQKLLIQVGLSEANLISSLRSMFLFLAQRGGIQPAEYVAIASNAISPVLKERAVFLAGKYAFELPESWLTAMPRERIREMLLKGVQDKTAYAEIEDEDIGNYEVRGKTAEELEEDVAYVNQVHRREMTFALNEFFKRHPDPTVYTCQLLDLASFKDMMEGKGGLRMGHSEPIGLN